MKYFFFIMAWLFASEVNAQSIDPDFKLMLDSAYDHKVREVSVEELIGMNKNELFVLDVRENEEFKVSHIKNARHVGYIWFDMRKIYDIPLDANIVVYCSVGIRSEKIARKLINAGYKNVHNLYGGIFGWINSGQPVYKQNGVQTSEIHTYNKAWARWVNKGTKVN